VKLFPKALTVDGRSVALKGSKVQKDSGGGGGPSQAFQEVLDASVATVDETYKGDGPLPKQEIAAFKDGVYTKRTLTKDVPAERLFGGGAYPEGKWVTAGSRPWAWKERSEWLCVPTGAMRLRSRSLGRSVPGP
jgi:type VI secretion system secreted protein VgrG